MIFLRLFLLKTHDLFSYFIGFTLFNFFLYLFAIYKFSFNLLFLIFFPIYIEIVYTSLYFLAFGFNFKYSLHNYFLIDDPVYGYKLRSNINSKDISFFIFDKFVFKPPFKRILNIKENIKSRIKFTTNDLNFRGKEISSNKNNFRIFCVGGSTTACDSCNDNETWPYQLNKIFSEKNNRNIEVINAGVEGWYSYQNYLNIKNSIIKLKPNLIILHQGWNEEFEFSSLNLGKYWKNKIARNVIQSNYFYCKKTILTLEQSIFLYKIQRFFFSSLFKKRMDFQNYKRFEVLLSDEYIKAWFINLREIINLAANLNIKVCMVDYPCLVTKKDTLFNRNLYIKNSRLDNNYAKYQAWSKYKISLFLKKINNYVSIFDIDEDFQKFRGKKRLKLFIDEIHLSPTGNKIFAKYLFAHLTSKTGGVDIESIRSKRMPVSLINTLSLPRYAREEILQDIYHVKMSKKLDKGSIPSDRYTTF
jgi:hypothetical protein